MKYYNPASQNIMTATVRHGTINHNSLADCCNDYFSAGDKHHDDNGPLAVPDQIPENELVPLLTM